MALKAQTALLTRYEGGGKGLTRVLGVTSGLSGTDANIIILTTTTEQQFTISII